MAVRDERSRRVLRAGSMQVLWALLLVHLILAGIALLFGRSAGYATSFSVCGGLAALTSMAFLAVFIVDRVSAFLSDWSSKIGKADQTPFNSMKGSPYHERDH